MFSNDRATLRDQYYQAWQKHHDRLPLSPLEQQIVDVIIDHPEYQPIMLQPDRHRDKDYLTELGETNPFLHLSLHLSLRDQIATNRPLGIVTVFTELSQQLDQHQAEHQMMQCLAEVLWQAQRDGNMPDDELYLNKLQALTSSKRYP